MKALVPERDWTPGSSGKPLASFSATGFYDGAAGAGLHAVSEPVLAQTASNFGLVGTFHGIYPKRGMTGEGYGDSRWFVKAGAVREKTD